MPTDYLVQMVCANSSDIAVTGDPVSCPSGTTARKLQVGEALPYHKMDYGGYQYSDSYPISDANGVSQAVQTYVFTNEPDKFNPQHGGYNIIGADSSNVFFRGTWDPSGGWQPWWTASCEAKGWVLFPNSSAAFSYGVAASPTINQPDCVTSTSATAAATVEWNNYPVYYATQKYLDSLVVFHYAPGYGAFEVNYFTKEYGVTRWEAWVEGTGTTPIGVQMQCPNSLYSASLHNKTYYLYDCRDWTRIVNLATPWNPHAVDSITHEATFAVDPLYTGSNLLKNTHMGGAYTANGPTYCDSPYWSRSSWSLQWGWDATPGPFSTAAGNCLLGFSMTSQPAGESIYQTVVPGPGSSSFSYGAMVWAPNYASGPVPSVKIQIVERNGFGYVVGAKQMVVQLDADPRIFSNTFTLNPSTQYVIYSIHPQAAYVDYRFTGAWVARQ